MLRKIVVAIALMATPCAAQQGSFGELAKARKTVSAPTLTERFGPDDLRRGELRVPPGRGPFPVAVVIHGGCWLAEMEDMTGLAPLADALTRRGIATWNIEYRRVGNPGGGWPGTFEDVAAGVDHLRSLAKRNRLDLKRVTVVGHSAGAHLALWTASRPKLDKAFRGSRPVRPASVVAIDGPGALAPFVGADKDVCGQPVITRLMGGTPRDRPAEYRAASPADHLPLGLRQLLVVADLAPFMKPYEEAARTSGDQVRVLAPRGADHFNIITPATPAGSQVVDFIVQEAFRGR